MGYTTSFIGAIELSRNLTMAEAKFLLSVSHEQTHIDAYFQWAPAETFKHIVLDQQEKFYKYGPQLEWLCAWLSKYGIVANGTMSWRGEDHEDTGTIVVSNNAVTIAPDKKRVGKLLKPLTLLKLQEIALEQMTKEDL